jgi:hypothetical protein
MVADNILTSYHVQVAREDKFKTILVEKTERTATSFDIKKQSIPDGTYFMRVAFLDALGMQGDFSEPTMIIKDTVAPELTVNAPASGMKVSGLETSVEVNGTVRGAVLVSVNGQVVLLSPDGRFTSTAYLREGTNQVRIVARDGSGNETVIIREVSYAKK